MSLRPVALQAPRPTMFVLPDVTLMRKRRHAERIAELRDTATETARAHWGQYVGTATHLVTALLPAVTDGDVTDEQVREHVGAAVFGLVVGHIEMAWGARPGQVNPYVHALLTRSAVAWDHYQSGYFMWAGHYAARRDGDLTELAAALGIATE